MSVDAAATFRECWFLQRYGNQARHQGTHTVGVVSHSALKRSLSQQREGESGARGGAGGTGV